MEETIKQLQSTAIPESLPQVLLRSKQSVPACSLNLIQHLASFCSCKIMPPTTVLKLQNVAPVTAWKLLL